MEGIDLFVKSLFFVKILSQGRRKEEEEEEFQSLEVREQAPSHLKILILYMNYLRQNLSYVVLNPVYSYEMSR
jgi:hypothetical protein